MPDLIPLTPLWGTQPREETLGGVTIREVTDLALASLTPRKGREAEARARAEPLLGAPLPGPNRHSFGPVLGASWFGADRWLVSAPLAAHEDLAADLKAAVGDAASVTEQTGGWCCFSVSGPACPALFEKLTAVDLSRATRGDALRLRLEHLACLVICRDAKDFYVLGQRSAAGSLFHALHVTSGSLGH